MSQLQNPPPLPRSLAGFTASVLPLLQRGVQANTIIADVKKIVETERWNSFDRFHQTTQTLVDAYQRNHAKTDVYRIQTGGEIGNGRWLIHEAADVHAATVDIVSPENARTRLLDYKLNPWHVVQWSASTPIGGLRCELLVIDSREDLLKAPPLALTGKFVLTRLNLWENRMLFFEKGAAGVITDTGPAHRSHLGEGGPDPAVAWTKFGWGGLALGGCHAHLIGLAISPAQGCELRAQIQAHGPLTIHAHVDVKRYTGTHDVVSGLIEGKDDPQSEVWAIAHGAEPGALDNASGVAVCIEIAGVLNRLIKSGKLPAPRRSIRLLHGYECYGFFHYLEHQRRFQPPLAGVCIDTVGAKPEMCNGKLRWHGTVAASATFVDDVGEAILRAALSSGSTGYECLSQPFVSTEDTLIGDPKYGFPCPLISNHPAKGYHSSADTPVLLHAPGLKSITAAMAGYLYYLANAGTAEMLEAAAWQTAKMKSLSAAPDARREFIRAQHAVNLERLKRWSWGGHKRDIDAQFAEYERALDASQSARPAKPASRKGDLIPRRTAPLAPTAENVRPELASRLEQGIPKWALYWADGNRGTGEIAALLSAELNRAVDEPEIVRYFEALSELGYVELIKRGDLVTRARLVSDLKALGVRAGMDLIVHSSLSKIGPLEDGPGTCIDALLSVIGKNGTLLMPSFNHFNANVFNPLATPTTNGAIPDAMWRRADAIRSAHPSHAIAAIGPRAAEWCAHHLENGIWSEKSPIGRLIHGGGYVLLLGVNCESSTAYHIAEISLNAGCLDQYGSDDRMVNEAGEVQAVRGLAWRAQNCPVHARKLDETLDSRKLQTHGKVGNANATLVKAIDVWKTRREHLEGVCPSCHIKPEKRKGQKI